MVLELVCRKTGIRVPQQERDAQGFEDLDAFFDKSSPQTVKTSLRKPSAKKQPISPVHYDYDNQDDDDDDDGSREMDIDNSKLTHTPTQQLDCPLKPCTDRLSPPVADNSYSPSDAVRDYNRSNGRVNQSTSSLRKATATANSRRIRLSSSSATSDSAEDEQVRLAVTTKQNGSSSKLKAGPASRKSVARREPSDDDSGSDALQVIEPTTESDEERVYKGGKKSRASLGSVGVSRKGKERARSLEEEEEDYRFDDNNADYGGGDDGYMSDGQDGGIPFEDDQPEGDHDETGEDEEDAPQPSISKTKTKANGKGKAKSNGKAAKAKAASKPKTKVAKEKAGPAQSNGRRRLVNKPTLEPIIERKRPRDDDEEDDDGGKHPSQGCTANREACSADEAVDWCSPSVSPDPRRAGRVLAQRARDLQAPGVRHGRPRDGRGREDSQGRSGLAHGQEEGRHPPRRER